ncbi:hypothetical protein HHI36_022167 [Cryptolaemus montrouzieri]|uniref:Uncharacterized protein n=1 Tax=Cryptolaemus montrouzieri TaxID=559131 RepID=A0ABD2MZ02_9CUCU
MDKAARDNYSNQKNSNNDAYKTSRGESVAAPGYLGSKSDTQNRCEQLNPNNQKYADSRKN